jgi:hypothetical protein
MPKADAEHRDFPGKVLDGFGRDSSVPDGFTRSWRNDKMIRFESNQIVQRDLVVTEDTHLRTELAKVLNKVVREGVVIVDEG